MAKKTCTDHPNKQTSYPDPVFFQQIYIPLVEKLLEQHGGMENILKQNPAFAQCVLKTLTDSKEDATSWLTKNFLISSSDINDSFIRVEQACEQKTTEFSGETGIKIDELD